MIQIPGRASLVCMVWLLAGWPALSGAGNPGPQAAVGAALAAKPMAPAEAAARQAREFWQHPSLLHWMRAGWAMERAANVDCTPLDQTDEEQNPLLKCPENPQFEAMKRLLTNGIVSLAPAVDVQSDVPSALEEAYPHYAAALRRARLTDVKPSFFRTSDRPAIARSSIDPDAALLLADALSADGADEMRISVKSPSRLEKDENRGLWDVGKILVTFKRAPTVHAITKSGSVLALTVDAMSIDLGGSSCVATAYNFLATQSTGPRGSGAQVLAWAGRAPPHDQVTIRTRRSDGRRPEDQLVIDDIDLDGDGIPDFSRWRGRFVPAAESDGLWTAILANLDGHWVLIDYDESEDCT